LDGVQDMTKLANAKTEAEVDAAAAELNKKIGAGAKGGVDKKRIALLDEMRGICVLAMVCYHAFFILATQFAVGWGMKFYEFFQPAQPVFAAMFILIAGICSRLSHDVKRRGLLLLVFAMGITLATVLLLPALGFQDTQVWFGILHLLALSTLLFGFGKRVFDKIPAFLGVLLCLALFFLTAPVGQGYLGMFGLHIDLPERLYQSNTLAFLGFHGPDFVSWDFFPLLPYCFLFLFGSFMGRYTENGGFPDFCYKKHMLFFGLLGRHALPIYLLHVPVFYGLVYFLRAVLAFGS